MAGLAIHLPVHVFLVTEEDKFWELIQSSPRERLAFFLELTQFLDHGSVFQDVLMTTHTFHAARYLQLFASFQFLMASVAFHPCLTMALVTEGDRLSNGLDGGPDWLEFTPWSGRNRSRWRLLSHSCASALSPRRQIICSSNCRGAALR